MKSCGGEEIQVKLWNMKREYDSAKLLHFEIVHRLEVPGGDFTELSLISQKRQ